MDVRRTLARTGLAGALLVGAVAGLVAVTGSAGGAAAPAPGDRPALAEQLHYGVRFSPFFLLDFGPNGVRPVTDLQAVSPSRGDQIVFRDRVVSGGDVVGRDGGTCTVVAVRPQAADPLELSCTATFSLPDGDLTTQGLAGAAPVKRLVITGGTGDYRSAEGTVTLTEHGPRRGELLIRVRGLAD